MIRTGIDWLCGGMTKKNEDGVIDARELADIICSASGEISKRCERGTRWYSAGFEGKGWLVSYCKRTSKLPDLMVELRGEYLTGCWEQAQAIGFWLVDQIRVNRIDFCWDFLGGMGNLGLEKVLYPEDFRWLRLPKKGDVVSFACGVTGDYTGFVRGKSEFRLKYYDKGLESGGSYPEILNGTVNEWWRLEVCVRGDLAKAQKFRSRDLKEQILGVVAARADYPPILGAFGEYHVKEIYRNVDRETLLIQDAERRLQARKEMFQRRTKDA